MSRVFKATITKPFPKIQKQLRGRNCKLPFVEKTDKSDKKKENKRIQVSKNKWSVSRFSLIGLMDLGDAPWGLDFYSLLLLSFPCLRQQTMC